MFSKVKNFVSLKAASVMGAVLAAPAIFAQDTGSSAVTLPETGCDIGSYVTAAITKLGAVVGIVIAGVFAFMIVKWGIKWARGIGKA